MQIVGDADVTVLRASGGYRLAFQGTSKAVNRKPPWAFESGIRISPDK